MIMEVLLDHESFHCSLAASPNLSAPPSTHFTLRCTAHCTALHTSHCTLHTAHYTALHTVHTLYTSHCTLYCSAHFTLHTAHFTLHTVLLCILHTSHCTLYWSAHCTHCIWQCAHTVHTVHCTWRNVHVQKTNCNVVHVYTLKTTTHTACCMLSNLTPLSATPSRKQHCNHHTCNMMCTFLFCCLKNHHTCILLSEKSREKQLRQCGVPTATTIHVIFLF